MKSLRQASRLPSGALALLLVFAACARDHSGPAARGAAPSPKPRVQQETPEQRLARLRKAEELALTNQLNMPEQGSVELMLVDYMIRYREFNRQRLVDFFTTSASAAEAESAMSPEQKYVLLGSKMLQETKNQNDLELALMRVSEAITEVPNGDRFFKSASRRLLGLSQAIVGGDIDTYEDIIAHLCAVYLVSPEDREAIYVLMERISQYVAPQIQARDETHFTRDAFFWAGTAWGATVLWRGFVRINWKNVPNPLHLLRGIGKRDGTAAATAPAAGSAAGTAADVASSKPASVLRHLRHHFIKAWTSGRYRSAMFQRATRGVVETSKAFAKDFTLPGLIGATIYAIREGDDRYRPTKIDPLRLLHALQRGAILALEDEATELEIEASKYAHEERLLREARSGLLNLPPARLKKAEENVQEALTNLAKLDVLRGQLIHFGSRANQYLEEVTRPDPLGPAYAPNAALPQDKEDEVTRKQLREEERFREILNRQEKLGAAYKELMTRVAAHEAKRRSADGVTEGYFAVEDLATVPVALPAIQLSLTSTVKLLRRVVVSGSGKPDDAEAPEAKTEANPAAGSSTRFGTRELHPATAKKLLIPEQPAEKPATAPAPMLFGK